MAAGPHVSIDIADKRFPGLATPLFSGLKLDIAASSVVALIGPSGVGKSTMLRMIAGIDPDYSGTITIDGKPVDQAPPPGFVFQDSRLLPWLSAIDNLLAVRPEMGAGEASRWLDRVGLYGYHEALPHELSGGMQRRVALARALAANPGLLLLDEPFVSLDRHLVGEMETLFAGLIAAEASTVLLVTHLPEDAARLADRVVVLEGRPVRIVADFGFDVKREARTPMEVLRLSQILTAQAAEVGV